MVTTSKPFLLYRMPPCFVKKSPEGIIPFTLVSHKNAHTIRGRLTLTVVERFRNVSCQNLDVEGNDNKQSTTLDKEKDIQRNNLNFKYLSLTLVLNILTVYFVFIGINTCKQFDIANIITAIVVQYSIDRSHANFGNRYTRTYFR